MTLAVTIVGPAQAFPGVCVGKDAAARFVHATEVVLLRNKGISVVTVMADYEGPLTPFAFILPVPADVVANRVKTVKRGILHRLEQISAPRLHAFYERDPCVSGPPEQDWEEHVRATGAGFLTLPGLPSLDRPYTLPNLISAPVLPIFKGAENEFRYVTLEPRAPEELATWLKERGYQAPAATLSTLTPHIGPGKKLLVAEVASLDHVEMVGQNSIQLAGIRYWSEQPFRALPLTLGLQNAATLQDLVIYVLDRKDRFQAANYDNVFVPSNLEIDARASDRIGPIYNALFDRVASRHPQAFVSEFAWSTAGCGEPCPDAPLGLDELMTLGADVIEARTTKTNAEPALWAETSAEQKRFEQQLSELPQGRRTEARLEHAQSLRELARRSALIARQTYALSRLHYRYTRASLPRDLELGPAPPVSGGVGIPKGESGELPHASLPAQQNQLQARFITRHPWKAELPCSTQFRYRWGKRWPSEVRASRLVPLGMDLARAPRDSELLAELLRTDLPELGITARAATPASVKPAVPAPPTATPTPSRSGLCAASAPGAAPAGHAHAFALLGIALLILRRPRAGG